MRKAIEEEPRVTTWEVSHLSWLGTEGSRNKKLRASKNVLRQLDGPVICVSALSPKEKKSAFYCHPDHFDLGHSGSRSDHREIPEVEAGKQWGQARNS